MAVAEPILVIADLKEVDDAGSTHYEAVLTGDQIHKMVEAGTLRFEGNIRPDWRNDKMKAKTKIKVNRWAKELLDGDAVMGNLSIRLDPDESQSDFQINGDEIHLYNGYFDTAVDSESRLHAIETAFAQKHTMNPDALDLGERRFSVRIWLLSTDQAHRVGKKFNTEGERVNESAAKSAYADAFSFDDLANRLIRQSPHLTYDNVESMQNSVSASSPKLFSFNTMSRAMEDHWPKLPYDSPSRDQMVKFLVDFWDALVAVRPEFGRLTLDERRKIRGSSLAGTALSIHGVVAIAGAMYERKLTDFSALSGLAAPAKTGSGVDVDFFDYGNRIWRDNGVLVSSVTSTGEARLTLRSSFQTRKAVAGAMLHQVGI